VLQAEHDEGEGLAPLERWRARYAGRLHEGGALVEGLRGAFGRVEHEECEYLYRVLAQELEPSERGYQVARQVLELERQLIGAGAVRPVGLRLLAR
jgi:hypothetical protein